MQNCTFLLPSHHLTWKNRPLRSVLLWLSIIVNHQLSLLTQLASVQVFSPPSSISFLPAIVKLQTASIFNSSSYKQRLPLDYAATWAPVRWPPGRPADSSPLSRLTHESLTLWTNSSSSLIWCLSVSPAVFLMGATLRLNSLTASTGLSSSPAVETQIPTRLFTIRRPRLPRELFIWGKRKGRSKQRRRKRVFVFLFMWGLL